MIEADLFSGRENPQWELSRDDAEHLRALLAALPPDPEPSSARSTGLGYRGLLCVDNDAVTLIQEGHVVAPAGRLADPGRELERWLVGTMPRALDDVRGLIEGCLPDR